MKGADISTWFVVVFGLLWVAAPVTQLLHLVAPRLHHKLGMTEADAFKPQFRWYLLEERAIAYADMTYLVAGLAFILLALLGERSALIYGLYTCACYVYIACISIPRWMLLSREGLLPMPGKQMGVYISYMLVFLLFGLYGLVYLWGLT